MSFIAPLLLAALPLVMLPIIIHLINQRRFQTVRWAAMMFLLAANRMSRGYARIRQWLIMAFRMLAIAGLIFAIARPLASGWLGLTAGGRADTTIVVLDRSPSMQQRGAGSGGSKLQTGRQQLAGALKALGSARWVLIDSLSQKPRELDSPESLVNSPSTGATSASSDVPGMLQAAHDYIKANQAGRTEIWICSDIRENDWDPESARWQSLRDSFLEFPQRVRLNLLAYPQISRENVSIRATNMRRRQIGDEAELLLSLSLKREGAAEGPLSLPVQFEIDGARLQLTIEMEGAEYDLKDHRISLEASHVRGWGRVSIPADANPADNEFCFVFDRPAPRQSVVVADDEPAARTLQLAAAISPDPAIACSAEIVSADQLPAQEWEKTALLLWQAPLPEGEAAGLVQRFIERGGQAIFFPPRLAGNAALFGGRWKSWVEEPEGTIVESWRGDQDLLARTQSGAALPVGQLEIRRHCGLEGELTALASLRGGQPLVARGTTARGGAYFCATTTAPGDSSLAADGVVFYVLVQRALAAGAAVLGNTRQLIAGDPPDDDPATWQRVIGSDEAISTEYPFHSGVYHAGEKLLAVNRAAEEDQAPVIADQRVAELFRGLDFARVDDQAGNISSLIQEIWRLFLASMIIALIVEAGLCLPKLVRPALAKP